jgi:hypothetical protein
VTNWGPSVDETREPCRERARVARPAPARARSWTGRAAMSVATDSGLPHLVTAGTHRTRVSEMRGTAAVSGRPSLQALQEAPTGPAAHATATAQRRHPGLPRHRHDRSNGSG